MKSSKFLEEAGELSLDAWEKLKPSKSLLIVGEEATRRCRPSYRRCFVREVCQWFVDWPVRLTALVWVCWFVAKGLYFLIQMSSECSRERREERLHEVKRWTSR